MKIERLYYVILCPYSEVSTRGIYSLDFLGSLTWGIEMLTRFCITKILMARTRKRQNQVLGHKSFTHLQGNSTKRRFECKLDVLATDVLASRGKRLAASAGRQTRWAMFVDLVGQKHSKPTFQEGSRWIFNLDFAGLFCGLFVLFTSIY